jgi:hypothetical protein
VHSIVVDQHQPTTLYGAGRGSEGGVWKSGDSGLHWRPASSGPASTIPELLFDPRGRAHAVGLGAPVRRSADESSWYVLDHPDGAVTVVSDLTVDPSLPTELAWINDVPQWWESNEVWLSSDDGRTWEDVTPAASQHDSAYEVQVLEFDCAGTLYAMGRFGRLYRRAAGAPHWLTSLGPWNTPRELVPDPRNPAVLHATDNLSYFRSLDGGRTWSSHGAGLSGAHSFDALTVNPSDTDELLVLASANPRTRRCYRSVDRGASWAAVGAGLPARDLVCLAVDPAVAGRVLVGTLQDGAFLSVDHGVSFVPWSEGLPDVPVHSIAFDPTRPALVWISTAGGGLWKRALP